MSVGAFQCDGCNGKSKGIACLEMQGLAGAKIGLFVLLHIKFLRHRFLTVRLGVGL